MLFLSLFLIWAQAEDVKYTFNISRTTHSPDGFSRELITVNEQYPGPTIYATIGDTLHVRVINSLNVSSTIHWHGMYQRGTNYYDGAVGFTQCAIPSGSELTYTFTLEQTGTYWWHAHFDSQIIDGLRGALIIYGNPTLYKDQYDEEFVLQLSDFYHTPAQDLLPWYISPASQGNEPIPDSGIINDAGVYNCSNAPADSDCNEARSIEQRYATFHVEPGKRYRLRIINVAAFSMFKISIDEHDFQVIEVDGVDVEPYSANMLSLNVAQRFSVIVTIKGAPKKNYWIRADIQTSCFPTEVPLFNEHAWGILHNKNIELALPTTKGRDVDDCKELLQMELRPVPAQNWNGSALSVTWNIYFENNEEDINYAFLGNYSYVTPPMNTFLLWRVRENEPIDPNQNPFYLDVEADAMIEFVINNADGGEHPIHLHGHTFAVLGVGKGTYNPSKSGQLRYINPPRRDVIGIPANGWTVIRFKADNPGVWPFHCHIDWHFTVGLAAAIIERPKDIQEVDIPDEILEFCNVYPARQRRLRKPFKPKP